MGRAHSPGHIPVQGGGEGYLRGGFFHAQKTTGLILVEIVNGYQNIPIPHAQLQKRVHEMECSGDQHLRLLDDHVPLISKCSTRP